MLKYPDKDIYISFSLCNKDIRILKDYMQIWKHKFNSTETDVTLISMDFRFMGLPKLSLDQKKKRLKFLNQYFTVHPLDIK